MGWIIFGVILLIVAAICFFAARSERAKLAAISAADTFTAQMLADLHARVSASVGPEALNHVCEVEGAIEADAPLKGPLSGRPCVAYTYTVTREYEEDVEETDDKGNKKLVTRKNSETLQTDSKRVDFWVRDATGRILVSPEGAEAELGEKSERFDAAYAAGGRVRTLGRRHREELLPVGAQVFVLGTALDRRGQPAIARGPKGGRFLISRRSERELTEAAAGSARGFMIATGVSGALGALAVIWGMVAR